MFLVPSFTPSSSNISGVLVTNGINSNEQLMLYNETSYGLLLTFMDNTIDVLPAYWNKDFIKDTPMGNVKWAVYNALTSSPSYPSATVYGSLYEKQEHVASINAGIARGVAITNPQDLQAAGSDSTLVNTTNSGGTIIKEYSSLSSLSDTTLVTNSGGYQIGVTVAGQVIQLLLSAIADPILRLGALTHMVEVLGNFRVDGTTTLTGNLAVTGTSTLNGLLTAVNTAFSGTLGVTGAITATNASETMGGTTATGLSDTASNLPGARLSKAVLGDLLDLSGSNAIINSLGNGGRLVVKDSGGTTRVSLFRKLILRSLSVSGSSQQSFAHNCGTTPDLVLVYAPNVQYKGADATNITFFNLSGSSSPIKALCIVF